MSRCTLYMKEVQIEYSILINNKYLYEYIIQF